MSDKFFVGLDVGGSKIEAALLRTSGVTDFQILQRQRVPTERDKGYEHVLIKMKNLIQKICLDEGVALSAIEHIGIGLPGSVDPKTQQMQNGNTPIFIRKNLIFDLHMGLSCPMEIFRVENDANCFVLAEVFFGVGKVFQKEHHLPVQEQLGIGIILGTGTGGGAVFQGRMLRGRHGGGMEIGHTQLVPNGKVCFCGRQGCAESVLSGVGIEDSYQRLGGERIPAAEVFDKARAGEFSALRIVQNYQQYLQTFLLNLTNIFDPDYFVLGGGVASETLIYQGLEERLSKEAFLSSSRPRVFQYSLGDSAGVLGAALLPYLGD